MLDGLQTNFDDIRDGGVKAIVRFAYNQGPFPDTEPDASKTQILRHIEQLTPLLQNNADVIAWLEAGFIGAWGEWHTSTNGLDNLADKQEILFALLKALPEMRTVQVRYPANIIEMFPNVLTEEQAFDGSNQSRIAHHNDCFLSSNTDVGTYERNDGVITIERDQFYLAELTRFTPMSGETCAPNPPRSECTSAIQEMELLHFSAINEAYHKGILRSWDEARRQQPERRPGRRGRQARQPSFPPARQRQVECRRNGRHELHERVERPHEHFERRRPTFRRTPPRTVAETFLRTSASRS